MLCQDSERKKEKVEEAHQPVFFVHLRLPGEETSVSIIPTENIACKQLIKKTNDAGCVLDGHLPENLEIFLFLCQAEEK